MRKISVRVLSMTLSLCLLSGCSSAPQTSDPSEDLPTIDELVLGSDYTDLKVDLRFLTFRTDIMDKLNGYAQEFRELYPGINVTYDGVEDYEASVITYLNSNADWGDIMMIPLGIETDVASEYFVPLGNTETLNKIYNFTNAWAYKEQVYGLASTGNANGILYNKRVFSEAGVSQIPATPEEFLEALQAIRDNTDAIPLYTNYADQWPMSSWDAYLGINATGLENYTNQILVHSKTPFTDNGDDTGPYAVYKILYEAVSRGLTEEDYTTTSEPLSYQMLNNGEIGCLVLSSWAVVQAQAAGDHPEDIGLMPFPITIDGKQYISINGDYSYGINRASSQDEQIAAMLYIKWLVEESGYSFSEGGLSVVKDGENPEFYDSLSECIIMEDAPALEGEELYFDELNTGSGLLFNANGNAKVQSIVEHAFLGDKSFDSIMAEWNEAWDLAQQKYQIEAE